MLWEIQNNKNYKSSRRRCNILISLPQSLVGIKPAALAKCTALIVASIFRIVYTGVLMCSTNCGNQHQYFINCKKYI